jgi:hypothetical protein
LRELAAAARRAGAPIEAPAAHRLARELLLELRAGRLPKPGLRTVREDREWLRGELAERLERHASTLRDFQAWAESRSLHGVSRAGLGDVAAELDQRVQRLRANGESSSDVSD